MYWTSQKYLEFFFYFFCFLKPNISISIYKGHLNLCIRTSKKYHSFFYYNSNFLNSFFSKSKIKSILARLLVIRWTAPSNYLPYPRGGYPWWRCRALPGPPSCSEWWWSWAGSLSWSRLCAPRWSCAVAWSWSWASSWPPLPGQRPAAPFPVCVQ